MNALWIGEACDLHHDPESGALITRLTTAVTVNTNIYCEQPFATPDGGRVAVARSENADPRMPPSDLYVADLVTLRIACLEQGIISHNFAAAAWTGLVYYLTGNGELARVSLDTREKEIVLTRWDLPLDFVLESVSPDQGYLVGVLCRADYVSQIVRIDLARRNWEVIFEHPEVLGHLQFNPVHGRDILVQLNRGMRLDHMRRVRHVQGGEEGATHFLIDRDGKNLRSLPIGPPYTASSAGHSGWLADTGRVGVAVHWSDPRHAGPLDERYPQGNLFTVAPGEERPVVFEAPEHRFNHVNVSRCGRYFVCDSYWKGLPGPIPLVVGNFETGKYRPIVSDCGASGGAAACSHPHPYLTADNRNVIYNADPYHVPHVYAARVPEGFLESLQ